MAGEGTVDALPYVDTGYDEAGIREVSYLVSYCHDLGVNFPYQHIAMNSGQLQQHNQGFGSGWVLLPLPKCS